MIARPFPCDNDRLAGLLADSLTDDQSVEVAGHLEHCPQCRHQLEILAGDEDEWSAVRDSLGSACFDDAPPQTFGQPAAGQAATGQADHSLLGAVSWVRSLLQPCPDGGLGRLGRYPVRGVIGQGGMGVVLQAWDEELNRPLALKLLAPHLASSGTARQRFLREARAAAAVVHPNVVPIYWITADTPIPYLVMPFIAGGNLQQRIDREGPLELEDCLRIGLQIAEGLAAAHRQGLIHRDIKPANVLLEAGGNRVLISDFGLARALDDVSMTVSGVIAGTPPFMSPEQARGESMRSHSDLFSLGSVLYAMATGRPPYRGASPLAVIRQIGEQPPTPIAELNERMPVWFETLINRLMQRSPEDRPQSAEEVGAILLGCLSHVRSGGKDALPDAVLAEPHAGPRASFGGRAVAVVLSLIAVVVLVTVAVMIVPGIVSPDRVKGSTAEITSTPIRPPIRPATSPADRVTASEPSAEKGIESQGIASQTAPQFSSPIPSEVRSRDVIVEPDTVSALPEIDWALWQVNGEIEQLRQAILSDLGTLEPDKESSDDQ